MFCARGERTGEPTVITTAEAVTFALEHQFAEPSVRAAALAHVVAPIADAAERAFAEQRCLLALRLMDALAPITMDVAYHNGTLPSAVVDSIRESPVGLMRAILAATLDHIERVLLQQSVVHGGHGQVKHG